jgi:hypothetical protein
VEGNIKKDRQRNKERVNKKETNKENKKEFRQGVLKIFMVLLNCYKQISSKIIFIYMAISIILSGKYFAMKSYGRFKVCSNLL